MKPVLVGNRKKKNLKNRATLKQKALKRQRRRRKIKLRRGMRNK